MSENGFQNFKKTAFLDSIFTHSFCLLYCPTAPPLKETGLSDFSHSPLLTPVKAVQQKSSGPARHLCSLTGLLTLGGLTSYPNILFYLLAV